MCVYMHTHTHMHMYMHHTQQIEAGLLSGNVKRIVDMLSWIFVLPPVITNHIHVGIAFIFPSLFGHL